MIVSFLAVNSMIADAATSAPADLAAGEAAITQGNFQSAAQILRPLADAGDLQAQVDLAALTLDGRDVGLKPDQAVAWLRHAAESGNGTAQARLGLAYAKGQHVAQDDLAAYRWLSAASQSKLRGDDALVIVKSNRDVVMARLSPAQRAAALAGQDQAVAQTPTPLAEATTAQGGGGNVTAAPLDPAASTSAPTETAAASGGPAAPFRVQIGSLPSLAEAKAEWHRLQRKYPTLLGKKAGTIDNVEVVGVGRRYRVTTGPFDTRDAARDFCSALKSAGQDCLVAAATN
jgi:hypothetical protein